jgi:hypothetical protein
MEWLGYLTTALFYVVVISSPIWITWGAGQIAGLYRRSKARAAGVVLLVAAGAVLAGLVLLRAMAASVLL